MPVAGIGLELSALERVDHVADGAGDGHGGLRSGCTGQSSPCRPVNASVPAEDLTATCCARSTPSAYPEDCLERLCGTVGGTGGRPGRPLHKLPPVLRGLPDGPPSP